MNKRFLHDWYVVSYLMGVEVVDVPDVKFVRFEVKVDWQLRGVEVELSQKICHFIINY